MTHPTPDLPTVPRYNAWREWKPIVAKVDVAAWFTLQNEIRALESPELQAGYAYCKYTGFDCIEFIILANFVDAAPVRRYPGGLILVPCEDVLRAAADRALARTPRSEHIYDAWFPLRSTAPEAIRDALLEIDDIVTFIARSYGVTARWMPKYIETVLPPKPVRTIEDSDWKRHAGALSRLRALPGSVRPAAARAAHWLLRAQQQRAGIDRFLYAWFALEGLLLALYEHASDVELPLPNEDASLSKSQRRRLRNDQIRQILVESMDHDPEQATMRAYFDVVVPIRKRSEAVLRAALGEQSPLIGWLYGGADGPAKLRTDIVHHGKSPHEIHTRFPVERIAQNVEDLANEIIVRTLRRMWRGEPLPTSTHSVTMTIYPEATIANAPDGGFVVQGDFRITHQLLAILGLL
ncbi:hypothetical protein WME97_22365 [Sorangium sp. So ce367]|uniref:hypothetical protein n=1 Tax=Sorangium sp. So ce367 TaxID=3133305 RepID=UPI003F5F3BFB